MIPADAKSLNRRTMLLQACSASTAAWTGLGIASPLLAQAPAAAAAASPVAGKDPRLVVHTTAPAVLETPLELLWDAPVTPLELLFVRNNQQPEGAATLEPSALRDWRIDIRGLTNKQAEIDGALLQRLGQVEHEMVLQCSGNSRALFSRASQTQGTQWGRGAMGNVRFAGVPLAKALEALGIEMRPNCRFVRAEGFDSPAAGKEDYEHSLPVDDLLNRGVLATRLNGRPLAAIHGGPVRLIIPGIYGTMQIKWLSRLTFESEETTNYNHVPRYRVPLQPIKPGVDYRFTLQNSSFNWNMKVKSVVLSPAPDAVVTADRLLVRGVAFNDGQAPIESVMISLDRGRSWRAARLQAATGRHAWRRFESRFAVRPGPLSIWTRAIDRLGRSQPLQGAVHWNPRGYEWNGVEKIDVMVRA